MLYFSYSQNQLEKQALETLASYDKQLLVTPKQIDVYDVIEKLLDVPYDWKYLTPDQSILGATAFNPGFIWAWPEPVYRVGMKPYKVPVEKGTILIDSTLTERGNIGRENFTVMHEVFHQVLHKKCFRNEPPNYAHFSKNPEYDSNGHKKLKTAIDYIEYQANQCAACFLMPRDLVIETFDKMFSRTSYSRLKWIYIDNLVREMAYEFNSSETAMKYRLNNLKILRNVGDGKCYEPINI
ncbi:MAG: ImmA/IrrE family metallo-endopeptidase [Clostridiales bacterium]|nr:ImmA/IrrE family metallo-endopeptidase [Clostridiales bacterium]